MTDIVARIEHFNHGRNPALLKLKYRLMAANVFSFYRGGCHLFYQDWPVAETLLNNAPPVLIAGDLHLENFGSYRGDNRLVYFDINDFDESILAPCSWDLARLLTSILVGTGPLGIDDAQAVQLGQALVMTYAQTLAKGQIGHVERATSTGLIRQLLYGLKKRSHKLFLKQYTVKRADKYHLRVDNKRRQTLPADEYAQVAELLESWRQKQPMPPFKQVVDIVRNVAGLGSLGVANYLILVQDKKTAASNFLLTLKEEPGSSLRPYVTIKQPPWGSEAERVATCQKRLQAVSPAMHHAVVDGGKSYLLREYQAQNQRVKITARTVKFGRVEKLIITMAKIAAWDHLRSSGYRGASSADDLIAFGERSDWQTPLFDYARHYADQVKTDYQVFKSAHGDS